MRYEIKSKILATKGFDVEVFRYDKNIAVEEKFKQLTFSHILHCYCNKIINHWFDKEECIFMRFIYLN